MFVGGGGVLLQGATAYFVAGCESFFISGCDRCCCKMRQVLQSATVLLRPCAMGVAGCDRTAPH